MMKSLLLATACATLIAAPALACRGTVEYEEVAALLAQANLPEAERASYAARLAEGESLHHRGHESDDPALRLQSLAILDKIREQITP